MTFRYLPSTTRAALQTQLTCAHCDSPGPFDHDHIVPLALGGGNEAGNLQRLCLKHHKAKTRNDIRMIRKADRQRKAFLGLKKRRGRPLQSPGFSKTLRKKFNGQVEKRV